MTSSQMPTHMGKYEILGELGRGTCGIVYKAFDPFVQREVALKVGFAEGVMDTQRTHQIKRDFFATSAH